MARGKSSLATLLTVYVLAAACARAPVEAADVTATRVPSQSPAPAERVWATTRTGAPYLPQVRQMQDKRPERPPRPSRGLVSLALK